MAKVGDFGLARDISDAGIYTITSSVSTLCNQNQTLKKIINRLASKAIMKSISSYDTIYTNELCVMWRVHLSD